jgi:basic membrane protein A
MTGKKSVTIWVDSDGFEQAPQFASVLLTSVVKGVGASVTAVIQDVIDGNFSATNYLGTLENSGTFLAPYHDLEATVDATLAEEVVQLGADITSGMVTVS